MLKHQFHPVNSENKTFIQKGLIANINQQLKKNCSTIIGRSNSGEILIAEYIEIEDANYTEIN